MTVNRSPITGNPELDSWTNEVTNALSSGAIGGGSVTTVVGGGGTPGRDGMDGINAATVDLYKAINMNTLPDGSAEDIQSSAMFGYDYTTGMLTAGAGRNLTNDLNGWTRDFPEESEGNYVFHIQVILADQADIEPDFPGTSFSVPTLVLDRSLPPVLRIEVRMRPMGTPESSVGDTTTDPSTWPVASDGTVFRNNEGAVRSLVAFIAFGGTDATAEQHRTYTYGWLKGNSNYEPTTNNGPGSSRFSRWVPVSPDDVAGADQFTCIVNNIN